MGYIILVTQLYQKDVDPVWLRGSVHISCVFILQAVWLTADHSFNCMGPTQNCVPNTGVGKAALPCFCRGCCSENTANNNFLYQKKINQPYLFSYTSVSSSTFASQAKLQSYLLLHSFPRLVALSSSPQLPCLNLKQTSNYFLPAAFPL